MPLAPSGRVERAAGAIPSQVAAAGPRSLWPAEGGPMPQPQVVQDARGELRVPARLHIELLIDAETSSATGSTINISSNGVYFTSSRYLEPLTVLGMRLLLPGEEGDATPEALDVRGV